MKNFQANSIGHDDVCISVCKEDFDSLGETSVAVCNKSSCQAIFPSQLKITNITPVFEKVD